MIYCELDDLLSSGIFKIPIKSIVVSYITTQKINISSRKFNVIFSKTFSNNYIQL